ncbi:MAG: BrnT family toxin [Pseudomonadota bacterium]|nr:BrnT family toxin [Pseudomonadota bacterium]
MDIEFDPAKDAANIEKHGISLSRAADLVVLARMIDDRFEEDRRRAYGLIDSLPHCLAYAIRNGRVRAISLRRAHAKEMRRYVE